NPLRVCLIHGVFFYAILNTFIKTVVISLMFWLPYYLKQKKLDRHAANIADLFEFGQIVGGFLLGYLCDKLNKRASLITPALLLNVILFIIISSFGAKEDLPGYYITLFIIGILLGGPANLIAAMKSHDISNNPEIIKKNKKIGATLVGIIDGSAYIGIALPQILIPYFVDIIFIFMISFLIFSCI
ncbi:MAG: MFS transporter, partial [Ignavibacteriae bacterium]|nr:MFS transporter [Ignavibacteriota bacterium]